MFAIVFFLPYQTVLASHNGLLRAIIRLDWIGTVLVFGFVSFLLIALQYGGNERPWNDGLVISFLVLVS